MHRVLTANAYGRLDSLGDGLYVLIRQHQFPDTYDDRDDYTAADSDRCFDWDFEHARWCFTKHTKTGERGFGSWAGKAKPEEVMAFIQDILKRKVPKWKVPKWTGFRVLGSVNRGNGHVVWSLELFAKHPESDTEVYSGCVAPNVRADPDRLISRNGWVCDYDGYKED